MIIYGNESFKNYDREMAQWMKDERYEYCEQTFDDSRKAIKRQFALVQMFISMFF